MKRLKDKGFALGAFAAALVAQIAITYSTLAFVGPEDISESARSTFWFSQRMVYDGASSNVGRYAMLAGWYHLFGFSFTAARAFRIFLHLLSLVALWSVLRRAIPRDWVRLIVFLTIALSPSWLFFNTVLAPNGTDLQFFPIVLWLLLRAFEARFDNRRYNLFLFLVGGASMVALMTYPTFTLYLPALLLLAVALFRESPPPRSQWIPGFASLTVGGLLPLVSVFAYVKNGHRLIWDAQTHSGLFRGGSGTLAWDWDIWAGAASTVIRDLFVEPASYIFYLPFVEFGGVLGAIGFVAVFLPYFLEHGALQRGRLAKLLIPVLILGLVALVVPNMARYGSGLRRCTPLLVAFYSLYVMAWVIADSSSPRIRKAVIALLATLTVHHVWTAGKNAVTLARETMPPVSWAPLRAIELDTAQIVPWFLNSRSPQDAIADVRRHLDEGRLLTCPFNRKRCKFDRIFGVLQADAYWNRGQKPGPLLAQNHAGQPFLLSLERWESNELIH